MRLQPNRAPLVEGHCRRAGPFVAGRATVVAVLWVFGIAGFLVLLLVVLAWGSRALRKGSPSSGGTADALGNFIDVFDPARARADRDLMSRRHQGEAAPAPDDDDEQPFWVIDGPGRRVRIRRPAHYYFDG